MRIELTGVGKRFGKVVALRDVNLSLPSGSRVALIGPNGSGKSTLTRVIMGILNCEGEVLLDGRSPFSERGEVARRLAYVPQIAPHLGAAVGEVIRAVATVRGRRPAAIGRLAARLDLDVDAVRSQPFCNLSGGMKQKLLIALALSSGASLLILDEPTSSLDARARDRFFELFDEVAPDATVLLSSHRIEELRHLARHVVALADGGVIHDGPAADYLDRRGASLVELRVDGARSEEVEWLRENQFRPGAEGWWVRTVTPADKVALVHAAGSGLGERLRNLLVRDLDGIDTSSRAPRDSGEV